MYDPGHVAPASRPSVERAHAIMREHVACRAYHCPRKGLALSVLVLSGRLHPDYWRYTN